MDETRTKLEEELVVPLKILSNLATKSRKDDTLVQVKEETV